MPNENSRADLCALRREITDLVALNAVAMVQNAIDAVNEGGQYQAIKYLFEMVGLYPANVQEGTEEEGSLARTLLAELGLSEVNGEEPERKVTARRPLESE